MRRIPRLAIAGTVAAGILGGCSPSSAGQSGLTYARYTFTCCTASDIQSAWHPGETVSLHWIVVAAGAAADRRPPPPPPPPLPPGAYAHLNERQGRAPPSRARPAAAPQTERRHHPATPPTIP